MSKNRKQHLGNKIVFYCLTMLFLASSGSPLRAQEFCVEPPSDLISWWGGDSNALDIAGENHGTLVNETTYAAGMVGHCFDLDGTDDCVQVHNPLGLPVGNSARTMMVWFRTPIDLTWYTESALIQYGTANWDQMFALITSMNAPGKLYFYGHGNDLPGITTILPDTWYHGAVTYDGTIVRLYLNGQQENSGLMSLNTVMSVDGLTLGLRSPGTWWQGQLDEAAVFNRALTADEIAAVYSAGSLGMCKPCVQPPSDIISWWRGENDGNDSFGENHGTLQSGISFSDGMVGQAFSLDGSDDYVSIPKIAAWDFGTTSFSLMAWFKTGVSSGIRDILRYDNAYTNGIWALVVLPGGQIDFAIYNNNRVGTDCVTPLTYCDNNWHLAIGVRDSSVSTLKIYIDGFLVNEVPEPNRNVVGASTAYPAIGRCGSYNGEYFAGLIDEPMVFKKALTTEEVAALYNAGPTGMCSFCDLTVDVSGNGAGTVTSDPAGIDCGPDCSEGYPFHTILTLTASASSGSYFAGWDVDCFACGIDQECELVMDSVINCSVNFSISPPGEASKSGSPMVVASGDGTVIDVTYTPANCAADHAIYWGMGPITETLDWSTAACGFGNSGMASIDPGTLAPGHFFYFVVVGNNGDYEGSYGKDSSNIERPEATGISNCEWEQQLFGACD